MQNIFNLNQTLFSTAFSPLAAENGDGLPWWAWVLIIIVVLVLLWLLWRWYSGRTRLPDQPTQPVPPPVVKASALPDSPVIAAPPAVAAPVVTAPAASAPAAVAPAAAAPAAPDDLTVLEGVGPKTAGLLQAAGIKTFAQLGAADVGWLNQILKDAGLQYIDPASWPEQARLAAAGSWEELKVLQDSLKGGRR